jgi:hypothetical protein
VLWLPGIALRRALALHRVGDPVVRFALQLAIGFSFWPLLLLWSSAAGLPWSTTAVRCIVALLAMVALITHRRRFALRWPPISPAHLVAAILLGLTAVSRVIQARSLAFPPWVDSVHHAAIVRAILAQGRVPVTLAPVLPDAPLAYHWGYHAFVAVVAWFAGLTSPLALPGLLLGLGQLVNTLTFVSVYAGARVLFRDRNAALAAATLATLVSFFPAFYLSWGRYTHLAGMFLLPPLVIALWRLARLRNRATLATAVVLAAGMFLIHVRVAVFAAITAAVILVATRKRARTLFRWSLAALLAAGIAAPRFVALARSAEVSTMLHARSDVDRELDTTVPIEDLFARNTAELLAIATCGLSGMAGWLGVPPWERVASFFFWAGIIVVSRRYTKHRPWKPLLLLAGISAAVGVVLQLRAGSLEFSRFASNSSALISSYLPICIAAGGVLAFVAEAVWRPRVAQAVVAVAMLVVGAGGVYMLRDVLIPQALLGDADDLAALNWISRNTPRNAVFAVDSEPWMNEARIGVDGGYWIPIVTGRRTLTPPALYAWALPPARVAAINAAMEAWQRGSPPPDATYAYVTRRGNQERWRNAASNHVVYRRGDIVVETLDRAERADR